MPKTDEMSPPDYKVLTRNIHEALLRADGYDTIAVEHDVKVQGRSGAIRQIDIQNCWRRAPHCDRVQAPLQARISTHRQVVFLRH